jgi:hypothetical protein
MSDDKGVLGNLPRSRPGRRSDKRAGDAPDTVAPAAGRLADAAEKAATRSEQTDAAVPKPPRPAAAKPRAAKRARPKAAAPPKSKPVPDPSAPAPEATGGDPVTEAARAAAKAVGAGVKIGTGLAQEVLRRLPRP